MKLVPRSIKIEKELWDYVGKRAKAIARASQSEPNKSAFLRTLIINDKNAQEKVVA